MKNNKINILSSFTFNTTVLRAVVEDGERYLYCIASSNSIDKHKTIFNEECQNYFVEQCKNNIIPIDIEHNVNFLFRVGKVIEAYTTKDDDDKVLFHVKIKLKDNIIANEVFNSISNPDTNYADVIKFGLSIKGNVIEAHYESVEGGIVVKVFDKVELKSITITERPSNQDTFLEAIERSIESLEEVSNIEEDNNKEVIRMIDNVLKASDVITNINAIVSEFVSQISAVQSANLTAENVLQIIKMFAEKYEHKIEWECCKGLWNSVDDTMETEDSEERTKVNSDNEVLRTELLSYKSNLVESLDLKISELKNDENNINKEELERNDEQTESSDTTTSEGTSSAINCNSERCKDSCECTINQQEIIVEQEVEVERAEEVVEEVKEELVVETVEVKAEINYEEIARTIANSILTEKLEAVERTYNEKLVEIESKLEKANKEVEVLRNMPLSSPPNIITKPEVVERSLNGIDKIKNRLNSDNKNVREMTINEIMKSFTKR